MVLNLTLITVILKFSLEKIGIVFFLLSGITRAYRNVKEAVRAVANFNDDYFACLNFALYFDRLYIFILKLICGKQVFLIYFKIQDSHSGQFERTLLQTGCNSSLSYVEGCTARNNSVKQMHAAVVEIISDCESTVNYYTVQNWYGGESNRSGGIYNFVTKRAICTGLNSNVSFSQIEASSAISWKYPSVTVSSPLSCGTFYSVAVAKGYQQADSGSKMIQSSPFSYSLIISKGICANRSTSTYKGRVKILSAAKFSRNYTECDSIILGAKALANTFPIIYLNGNYIHLEHEAATTKIAVEKIFFLQGIGFKTESANTLLLRGFSKDVFYNLPRELFKEVLNSINFDI